MTIANILLISNARVRVTVTTEIQVTDNWGGTTEINQVVGQAKKAALSRLISIFAHDEIKIIGEPVVTMILVDAKEK